MNGNGPPPPPYWASPVTPPGAPAAASALPPGIDPSWLQGQAPNPAALAGGLPPVEQVSPGSMFGQGAAPPTMPQQPPLAPEAPAPPSQHLAVSFARPPATSDEPSGSGDPSKKAADALAYYAKGVTPAKPTTAAASGAAKDGDYWGVKKAQKELLGTFDEQKASMARQGAAEGDKNAMLADHGAELARIKQEDAAIDHEAERVANDQFAAHMAETQKQLDAVRAKKIDPGRYMSDKSGFLAVLGGVAGGMYMGLNKLSSNPFLDDLNKQIDRDVDSQKADLANERESVNGRLSMLGQMRSVYKDHQLADLQSRNLYYEAAKEGIAAEGARYDTPIAKERTAQAISVVDHAQKQLDLQIREQAQAHAQAQAAAAAAQARAARKEQFEQTVKLIELGQSDKKIDAEFGTGTDGLGKAGRQTMALDHAKAQQELEANLAAVTAAQKDIKAIAAGGSLGNAASHLPGWVPGVSGARKDVNAREAYRSLVIPALGAAWKMRTGGVEPKNPKIFEEQAQAYVPQPDDSEDVIADRMERLRKHMTEAAGAQGARVAMPETVKPKR